MSTSIEHSSGTLLNASPPRIRARLIEGRSNRSLDSRAKGSVSMRREAAWALGIAVAPPPGVPPWGAGPGALVRTARTPLGPTPPGGAVGAPLGGKDGAP